MLQIFDALDRDLYAPSVICQGQGPLIDELKARDIPVHFAPSLVRSVHPWHDWRAISQLRLLFRNIKPAIVHTHSSKPGIIGRFAAHLEHIPTIIHHVQGYAFHEFSPYLQRMIYSKLEAAAARWSTKIIYVSEEERQLSINNGWVKPEQTIRIPNVLDFSGRTTKYHGSMKNECRAECGLKPGELGILVIGRIDHQKQPQILVPIAQELEKIAANQPWKLIVAGDGPLMPKLKSQIQEAQMEHRIELLGWVKDSARLFQSLDIVMLPSLWEGLPLVLIEAFGGSKPIVASNIKGNRELVTPDVGFLCQPKSPASYAQALSQLIFDKDLRTTLGQNAWQKAPDYDLYRVMPRVQELYDELTGRRRYETTRRAA
jgi:glycosyltransferase involved in cell wall biosynthesis